MAYINYDKIKVTPMQLPANRVHGTLEGYRCGCKCAPCRLAAADYAIEKRREPKTLPAMEARGYILWLMDCGCTLQAIARAAGLDYEKTIRPIYHGKVKTIRKTTHDAIMAQQGIPSAGGALVPVEPFRAVVKSINESGMCTAELCRQLGVRHSMFLKNKRMRLETALKIQEIARVRRAFGAKPSITLEPITTNFETVAEILDNAKIPVLNTNGKLRVTQRRKDVPARRDYEEVGVK